MKNNTDITKIKQVIEIDARQFPQFIADEWVLLHVSSESEKTHEGDTVTRGIYIMGRE
ncbi:MAG: hypothetical protein HY026_05545 [Deltaproteobacteria bacterium]|nr:hypothetical protein [Deltaproteobacteria bacterium]